MTRLLLFNKPFNVICQFSAHPNYLTLADFIVYPDVYPAGRLDTDSEGLVLLTSDGRLQHRITDPKHKLPKCYWVQVEGVPTSKALNQLQQGVVLKDGLTRPAQVKCFSADQLDDCGEPIGLWVRTPPVRVRKAIPTAWIQLTLREGRNRQVRRMTAAVGFPTLRLVRVSVGDWSLSGMPEGSVRWVDVNTRH